MVISSQKTDAGKLTRGRAQTTSAVSSQGTARPLAYRITIYDYITVVLPPSQDQLTDKPGGGLFSFQAPKAVALILIEILCIELCARDTIDKTI